MIYFLQYYFLRIFLFKPVFATTGYHSDKHLQIRIEVKQICCRVSLYLWEDDAVASVFIGCLNPLLVSSCFFHHREHASAGHQASVETEKIENPSLFHGQKWNGFPHVSSIPMNILPQFFHD